MCLSRLKYGYFSYKNAWIRYRRPLFIHPPELFYGFAHFILRVLDCVTETPESLEEPGQFLI